MPPVLEVKRERVGSFNLFRLTGSLGITGYSKIKAELHDEIKDSVFDLAKLEYLDSSGVSILLSLKNKGYKVHLFNLNTQAREVLQIVGLMGFFYVYKTEQDFREAMGLEEPVLN